MSEDYSNERKNIFSITDLIIILGLVIPWRIYSGTSDIGGRSIEVTQYAFFKIMSADGLEYQYTLGGGGGPFYALFQIIAVLFLLHAAITRLFQLVRRNKQLIGTIGSDLFFAGVFSLSSALLVRRDLHSFVNIIDGTDWGYIIEGTELTSIIPIASILFLTGSFLEYRSTKFFWINSIGNTIRYALLGLFTVISVFPLIWVAIVSVNKQSVIRAGVPLWPLDPTKPLDFGSYSRFFLFEGNFTLAWILFISAGLLIILMYKQVTNAGKWLDGIQGYLYNKFSPEKATNNNVSLFYWIMLMTEFLTSMLFLTLIIAEEPVFGIEGAHFKWFLELAEDAGGHRFPVGNWFLITTVICTGVSLFGIFLSVLSAYALSRFKFPGKTGMVGVVLGTQMFPGIILLLPLLVMWKSLGLTNSIFGLTLAYASFAVPFSTFMLKGFFDSLSTDLEEAAMVDGCTRVGAFMRVILPLSLPGLASTFLFSFLTGYTEYLLALTLYGADSDNYTIALALINVFRVDYQNYYFPDLALFSLIVAAPILLIFVYLQRFLIAGLSAGGTKG